MIFLPRLLLIVIVSPIYANFNTYEKEYVTCEADQFTCHDGLKCIDRKERCDLNLNCDDGSDENDCEYIRKDSKCYKHQFLCRNGQCIDGNRLCDGIYDCSEGEDEQSNICRETRKCNENEFKCSNNQCIPKAWVCDGASDCSNDEENCPPEESTSEVKRCEHRRCISKSFWSLLVDFKCPKVEDESDCDSCIGKFKCGSGECISMDWRCDNQMDCRDISDEVDCGKLTNAIKLYIRHQHPVCSEHEFKCKNEECIYWDRVCNGQHDGCSDNSDEGGNCATACKDSPCDHRCIRSPNGPVCACHDGYMLNADQKSCKDINECFNGRIPCAQLCDNTPGSYRCSCFSGFARSSDKSSCKSFDSQKFFFYSSHDTIYRMRPHLTKVKSTNGSNVVGLDMNFDKKLLYFTIKGSDTLYEFNWTGSDVNTVKNIGSPTQVAVDWITENVYFIDESQAIKVCHMEKRNCITLIKLREGKKIKSLAVDALHRRLFYGIIEILNSTYHTSTIYAINLDVTQKRLVSKDAFFIPAITCDFYTERIYYVGLETKQIWSVKYDGTGKELMIAKSEFITWPIEIKLFESHAYVSNSGSNVVAICRMYGDRQCEAFPLNVNQPDNLVIAQKSRQKSGKNACAANKCNTICTSSDLGAKCICDFGHMVEAGVECNSVKAHYNKPIFAENDGEIYRQLREFSSKIFKQFLFFGSVYTGVSYLCNTMINAQWCHMVFGE